MGSQDPGSKGDTGRGEQNATLSREAEGCLHTLGCHTHQERESVLKRETTGWGGQLEGSHSISAALPNKYDPMQTLRP